jgi:hypothetical protein
MNNTLYLHLLRNIGHKKIISKNCTKVDGNNRYWTSMINGSLIV